MALQNFRKYISRRNGLFQTSIRVSLVKIANRLSSIIDQFSVRKKNAVLRTQFFESENLFFNAVREQNIVGCKIDDIFAFTKRKSLVEGGAVSQVFFVRKIFNLGMLFCVFG